VCILITAIGDMEFMCIVIVLMCSVTHAGENCVKFDEYLKSWLLKRRVPPKA